MRCGNQENVIVFLKHKENKMPRSNKKTTTTKKRAGFKVSSERKTTPRRKTVDSRRSEPGDVFWNKVIAGFKKLLSPAFPK